MGGEGGGGDVSFFFPLLLLPCLGEEFYTLVLCVCQ